MTRTLTLTEDQVTALLDFFNLEDGVLGVEWGDKPESPRAHWADQTCEAGTLTFWRYGLRTVIARGKVEAKSDE